MTLLPRRLAHLPAACVVLAMSAALAGFVRISFQPASPGFFWAGPPGGETQVSYVIQRDGSEDVLDDSEVAAVRLGAERWEELAASRIALVEDPSADASRTDFESNDIHLIRWDDDGSSGLFPPGSSIVALTPLEASISTGQIIDADIVFNGAHVFSTDPQGGTFDVQSVATHELGHFIGFDHGGGPLTTMHSTIVAGTTTARSLSRDEEAAAVHVYPAAGVLRGRIAGTVFAQGGGGLRYAQVVAIDDTTGEVASADVSDVAGNYSIEGLPAGSYSLYVEPLDGPFRAGDTIALQGQTADTFTTTWYPGGAVVLGAGGQGTATWSAAPTIALTITDGYASPLVAGGATVAVLRGVGLSTVTSTRVTGGGVSTTHQFLAGELRVTCTAQPSAARGVRSLEVSDGSGRVAVLTAGVEVQDPDPVLTGVTPQTLQPEGGELLTITGDRLVAGSDVVVGGQLATNVQFISAQELRATAPPSPGTTTPVDVVVIRPDGREARLTGGVTYLADPAPTSVDPPRAPVSGGTRHYIRGTGFAQGAVVDVGGSGAIVLSVTPTAIEVILPPNPAGPADVLVRVGNEEGLLASGVTYVDAPAPIVTSFSPTSGPSSGGTLVTLVGQGFAPDAQVRFDGLSAVGVQVDATGDRITCLAPSHAAGAAEVRVRNPSTDLESIGPGTYSYVGAGTFVASGGGGGGGCAMAAGRPAGASWLGLAVVVLALAVGRRSGR